MFTAWSKTKAQIKCSFKYNGFSAGCVGRSFRVWEDTMLTPLPLLLMKNNEGSHYVTTSSHSVLKKKQNGKGRNGGGELYWLSSFCITAPNQSTLKYFILFEFFLQVGILDLRVYVVSNLFWISALQNNLLSIYQAHYATQRLGYSS